MEFDYEICHIPGKANSQADALLQRPDYDQGTHDNENIVVLLEHVFIKATTVSTSNAEQDNKVLKPWVDPHNSSSSMESGIRKEDDFVITMSNHFTTQVVIGTAFIAHVALLEHASSTNMMLTLIL